VSYLVYRRFYVLDEGRYAAIVEELRVRKEAATAQAPTAPAASASGEEEHAGA
jgi:hypothetical protein